MKLANQKATFTLVDAACRHFHVTFYSDAYGDPASISVFWEGGTTVEYPNEDAKWRPCVTHARELVRLATGAKSVGPFAKARAKTTRPSLRIHGA